MRTVTGFRNEVFRCPMRCGIEPLDSRDKPPKVNHAVVQMLKMREPETRIFCDRHAREYVKYYSQDKQTLYCE